MGVPSFDVVQAVETALNRSELVEAVKEAKAAFPLLSGSADLKRKAGYRPLTPSEQKLLTRQGNTAEDWKSVWVASDFDPKQVVGCHFLGPCLLERFSGSLEVEGLSFPAGLFHSTLAWCVVGKDALIRNVRLANRTVVKEGAVLLDVGALSIDGEDSFGNGLVCLIAIETGGREIRLFAELTVEGAWVLSRSRSNRSLLASYNNQVDAYVKRVSSPFNVIGPKARILHTPKLTGLFLGSSGCIDSAASVSHATVLSAQGEETSISQGAIVTSSILQWGCEVTREAIVDSSLLTEHSHVERHGKVTHSILGPNTGVAEGEVTSALLGPFVGFHHQAILIAALWPEGKGNVGYGANIGSNHTAKAPDQEIWPGEGTFFGLGVNIKFPTDLTRSPYTIIASGVNMLPQRVEFPFSLINTPKAVYPGISPAFNEIVPAWVLSDNIYMVKRNEGKYQKRNKARRSRFDFEVFRPEIVERMVDARRRLQAAKEGALPAGRQVYTSKEIEGLGKNYLLEPSRKRAIETYTFYIRYYALLGLKRELEDLAATAKLQKVEQLLNEKSPPPRWEHERRLLIKEYPGGDLKELLKELARIQERIASDVQVSKEKDDRRGAEVIEDYAEAHPPAKEDSFVKETWAATAQLKKEVDSLIRTLQKQGSHPKISSQPVATR